MKNILILLGCTALFFIVFSPAKLYFASDDFDSIYAFAQTDVSNILHTSFRPFTDFGLRLTYYFTADNALYYMFTNTLLHALCTFMMYAVSGQFFAFTYEPAKTKKLALFTAILFLFYPYHSEAIFWMVGRGGSQSTLFALISLYFFLQKPPKIHYTIFGVVSFIVGALSYEAVWVLPLILILFAWLLAENKQQKLKQAAFYWLALFACLLFRFYNTNTVVGTPYGSQKVLSFDPVFLLHNFFTLLTRAFVPPTRSTFWYLIFCSLLLVLLMFCIFLLKNKINKILLVTAASFIISLMPVITFGIDTHDTESERFLYFPSVFVCLLVVPLAFILLKNKFSLTILSLVVVCFLRLNTSYKTYVSAGLVTKTTVQAVKMLPPTDSLFCVNVPIQYEGAFMFRNGLINMVNIYKPGTKTIIKSSSEFYQPALKYFSKQAAVKDLQLLPTDTIKISSFPTFLWQENGLTIYNR